MNKMKTVLGMALMAVSIAAHAADPIPDPTVQIATPPMGLPGVNRATQSAPFATPVFNNSYSELNIQGVSISPRSPRKNKVFMNNGFYKVNDVVNNAWKIKSITSKKVVLVNLETKVTKILHISGE